MKKYLVLFLLGACGFMPMYSNADRDIYVAPISGTNGIDLRNALNARFGGGKEVDARYKLVVKLEEPSTQFKAIQATGDATWQEVRLNASYVLSEGDTEIARGNETASESYTFVRNLVAATASYNNAVQNTISVLADKIGARVIAETVTENKSQ